MTETKLSLILESQVFPQRLPSPTVTFLVRTHQLGFMDFFFFSHGGIKNTLSVNSETHTSYLYSSIYYIEIIWVLYFQLNF